MCSHKLIFFVWCVCCSGVWIQHALDLKGRLERVQRRVARYVCNRYHNTSSVTGSSLAGILLKDAEQSLVSYISIKSHTNWWPFLLSLSWGHLKADFSDSDCKYPKNHETYLYIKETSKFSKTNLKLYSQSNSQIIINKLSAGCF